MTYSGVSEGAYPTYPTYPGISCGHTPHTPSVSHLPVTDEDINYVWRGAPPAALCKYCQVIQNMVCESDYPLPREKKPSRLINSIFNNHFRISKLAVVLSSRRSVLSAKPHNLIPVTKPRSVLLKSHNRATEIKVRLDIVRCRHEIATIWENTKRAMGWVS